MVRKLFRSLRAKLREFVLQEQAQRRVSRLGEPQFRLARAYRDAALKRLAVARIVRAPDLSPAGLSLYRDSVLFLAMALLASEPAVPGVEHLDPRTALEALDPVLKARRLLTPSSFGSVRSMLTADDPMALDNMQPDAAARAREDLEATARWLSGLVDVRSPREFAYSRVRRVAALLACGVGFLWWLGEHTVFSRNLALHRTARSSMPALDTAPYAVVDGEYNGRFGFHSAEADSPWLTIDLGRPHHISSFKVFGRGDCCFDQSIPLNLDVSDDGESFWTIAQRTSPFSETDPWVVEEHLVTRFVRLRSQRHTVLVLGEVEVYGYLW